jgi:hypothetical protein
MASSQVPWGRAPAQAHIAALDLAELANAT